MAERTPRTGVRSPVGVDINRASIARVYDYSLGGKDNYDVDRAAYEEILAVAPRQGDVSVMNRRWLHRVVRYLADIGGIDQFLDIGAGLPTRANTHEVAQRQNPESRVIYIDNDQVCNAHGRVLLEQNENTHFLFGDILQEGTLLENDSVIRHLDMNRPIGLILCGLLHHLDDELDPVGLTRAYVDKLPPGSYLAISHFHDPGPAEPELHSLARELERRFTKKGLGSGWYRTTEQILEYFGGLPLVEPGLVQLEDWWPAGPSLRDRYPEEQVMIGGIAYKPTVTEPGRG